MNAPQGYRWPERPCGGWKEHAALVAATESSSELYSYSLVHISDIM